MGFGGANWGTRIDLSGREVRPGGGGHVSVFDVARVGAVDLASVPAQRFRTKAEQRVSLPRSTAQGWQRTYRLRLLAVDATAALTGAAAAVATVHGRMAEDRADVRYLLASLLLPVVWVVAVSAARAYEERFTGIGSEEFRRVATAAVWLTVLVASSAWLTRYHLARGFVVAAMAITLAASVVGRYALRKHLHRWRSRGACMDMTVVVGHPAQVAELVRQARRQPYHGLQVVGACIPEGSDPSDVDALGVPILGSFATLADVLRRSEPDAVTVLSCPEMDGPALRRLAWELEGTRTNLLVAPALMDVAGPRIAIRPVCGLPLLHVEEPEFAGGRRMVKSVTDRLVAATAVVVLLPLLAIVAAAIKLTSRGPVLFRQSRVGHLGEDFTILKFRTMVQDAEERLPALAALNQSSDGVLFKIRQDPRVSRVGRFLRRYSIDELPQLLNVIAGSMSLVGPRPPLRHEVERYGDDVHRRFLVKPGLTGLWQISGRADLSWDESVRLDLRYVENWSPALDLMILWKTAAVVLRGSGAY